MVFSLSIGILCRLLYLRLMNIGRLVRVESTQQTIICTLAGAHGSPGCCQLVSWSTSLLPSTSLVKVLATTRTSICICTEGSLDGHPSGTQTSTWSVHVGRQLHGGQEPQLPLGYSMRDVDINQGSAPSSRTWASIHDVPDKRSCKTCEGSVCEVYVGHLPRTWTRIWNMHL